MPTSTVAHIDLDTLRDAVATRGRAWAAAESLDAAADEELLQAREVLLLSQTLQYATDHVPYYRELFRERGFSTADFRCAADLDGLPILTRRTVIERLRDFVSREATVTTITSTSGTTSAVRLPRFIGAAEQEACALLHRLALGPGAAPPSRDIVLRLVPTMRRYLSAGPDGGVPQILVAMSLHYPKYPPRNGYDDFAIRQLFEPVPIPGTAERVTAIHATPPFLMRILNDEMRARRLSPRQTAVRMIACSGGPVTNRIRSAVRDEWGVPLITSYSLSELNAVAMECSVNPRSYHWDAAAYPEILDPVTLEQVPPGGEGVLVVTSLYPFQQAQPFIRYDTGDLVRYEGRTCACGFVGACMSYVGRSDHCLDMTCLGPTGRRFLSSALVHDVLEDFDEIPSLLHPKFAMAKRELAGGQVELQVSLEVYQIVDAATSADLQARIVGALRARHPEWEPLVRAGRLRWDVRLHNRGELGSFVRMYPES